MSWSEYLFSLKMILISKDHFLSIVNNFKFNIYYASSTDYLYMIKSALIFKEVVNDYSDWILFSQLKFIFDINVWSQG